MKNLMILICILLWGFAFAEEETGKVYVHSLEEGMDMSPLTAKEYVKTQGAGESKSITKDLPAPKEMDKILSEAGLNEESKKMDQMDKDLLIMKAKKRDIASLLKSYPEIKKEKLEKLKSLVGALK